MVRVGMFLGGRYEILEKIGSGGMSEVFKAKDHKLNRMVAIKVLQQEFNADSSFVSKFQMEAQSAACLSHQNVVGIYDVGKEGDDHYIVMEMVEGVTLKEFIQKKGKLDIRESIGVAMQVAQAIEAAHEQNIVHRDIKPQNIMISRDGKVKVTDFGIARAASTQTISSNTMGSVHYISPEQARGGYCDERSDIYSLGITLYEMLTGRLPFEGDNTVSIALQHIQGEMVPPSEFEKMIPVSLEKIILKCTQKKPEQRYATATALIADLKKALMTPEEDFVKVIPLTNDNPTIIMSDDDVAKIKENVKQSAAAAGTSKEVSAEEAYQRGMDDELDDIMDEFSDDDDEDYDDDDDINPKFEKIVTGIGIAIAVLIVILAVYVLGKAFNIFGNGKAPAEQSSEEITSEANTVEMPDLIGKTKEEAEEILKSLNLGSKPEFEYDEDTEDGKIFFQEVEAGTQVEKNTQVYYIICTKEDVIQIPQEIMGMTYNNALKALAAKGLRAEKEEVFSSTVDAGIVTGASPDFGKEVPLDTTVTLYVSKGPEISMVDVPDLYNRTQAEAETLLKSAGLKLGDVAQGNSDTVPEGRIIKQTVAAGSSAKEGSKVGITLSIGPSVKDVKLPNLVGKMETEAKDALTKLKLSVKVEQQASDKKIGEVIKMDPGAETTVKEGTTITLVVSTGPAIVTIPDLRTMTVAQAKEALEKLGLLLGNVKEDYSTTYPAGQVISQNAEGTIAVGSKIDIVVSLGKEPKPTEPPTTAAPEQPTTDAPQNQTEGPAV